MDLLKIEQWFPFTINNVIQPMIVIKGEYNKQNITIVNTKSIYDNVFDYTLFKYEDNLSYIILHTYYDIYPPSNGDVVLNNIKSKSSVASLPRETINFYYVVLLLGVCYILI